MKVRFNCNYILVSYKLVNGFKREFKMLDESNQKSRLEYLMSCKKCEDLKEQGYILEIYKLEK